MAVGVYPGSFNPPTVAHLAIARAALDQCGLERVDLVLSRGALGKDDGDMVSIDDRLRVLRAVAETHPWLQPRITSRRYIVDIADGYDVLVLGADKWVQVIDPVWYGDDPVARDAIVARLPVVACAPRPGHPLPDGTDQVVVLDVHPDHGEVSASAVRDGRREWMLPEAIAFDDWTGAWSEPARYRARH